MSHTVQPYDINEIGSSGYGRITAKIQGYWSSDPITLYVQRNNYGSDEGWKTSLSHSSGGRDSKEVVSDMEAARNFASAMIALADIGETLIAEHGVALEAAYEAERARRLAVEEAEKAAKVAAIEADPAIGLAVAAGIVAEMAASAANTYAVTRVFRKRGSKVTSNVVARCNYKTRFTVNGCTVSKKEAIEYIASYAELVEQKG